jgi:hypothetical protein
MSVALSNLPLPADCIFVINSFAFLDPVQYKNKLIKKSVNTLLRMAVSVYSWPNFEDLTELPHDIYVFKWYTYHIQHQIWFCKCGDYVDGTHIPNVCRCKCT